MNGNERKGGAMWRLNSGRKERFGVWKAKTKKKRKKLKNIPMIKGKIIGETVERI